MLMTVNVIFNNKLHVMKTFNSSMEKILKTLRYKQEIYVVSSTYSLGIIKWSKSESSLLVTAEC